MIEVKNLCKSFGAKTVFRNYSEIFDEGPNCLMGGSGSGKTTLARIIMGLEKPDSGEIIGAQSRRINCVFQENRLIEELSAIRNLKMVCKKEKYGEALDLLVRLGLEGSTDCPASTLSGGMKRRVAIARALINPADMYIFDEPFKELDGARKDSVIGIINERTKNSLSIVITHDLADAKALGARIITIG